MTTAAFDTPKVTVTRNIPETTLTDGNEVVESDNGVGPNPDGGSRVTATDAAVETAKAPVIRDIPTPGTFADRDLLSGTYPVIVTNVKYCITSQEEPYFRVELTITESDEKEEPPTLGDRCEGRQLWIDLAVDEYDRLGGDFYNKLALLGIREGFWGKVREADPLELAAATCRELMGKSAWVRVKTKEYEGQYYNKVWPVPYDGRIGIRRITPQMAPLLHHCEHVDHCPQRHLEWAALEFAIPLADGELEDDELSEAAHALRLAGWLRAEDLPVTTVEELSARFVKVRNRADAVDHWREQGHVGRRSTDS